jgi:hypothetical protein
MTSRPVAALALAVALLAGCGDDDATPATTTAEATTTTTEVGTTTTQGPACPPVNVPDTAAEVTEQDGDADGDGTDDELRTYRVGDEWHLQVELAADGGSDLVLPSFGGGVGLVGGADVDEDGTDEVWARTGSGASATIVGLARLVDCELQRVMFATGELAELPVGGSVGTSSGLECRAGVVTAFTATLTAGSTYEVVATSYALEGTTLVERGAETTSVEATDDEFARYTSFSCGDLIL